MKDLYQSLNNNCQYFQERFEECKKLEDLLRNLSKYAKTNVPDTKETIDFFDGKYDGRALYPCHDTSITW